MITKIKKIICYFFGHKYQKMLYINRQYDVYVCGRCGRQLIKSKGRRI